MVGYESFSISADPNDKITFMAKQSWSDLLYIGLKIQSDIKEKYLSGKAYVPIVGDTFDTVTRVYVVTKVVIRTNAKEFYPYCFNTEFLIYLEVLSEKERKSWGNL